MPKGGASSLTPVYAGLREDLDTFLRAFMQLDTIRFVDYKKLFQHRGMVQCFNGRSNSAEIIEFNECLLVHCLPYMEEFVCEGVPRSLKERLFGLYSLYTFFYVQQENHVVKVRMDPDASRNFRKLAELLRQIRIYDGYMACLKLLEDKAIKHVAFIAIYDPSNFKRFYTDDKVTGVSVLTNLNDPLCNIKSLYESDTFSMLGYVHKEYAKLKETSGFFGCPLPDVKQKVKEIVEQHSKNIEKHFGVDEIINTDHSSEQLCSRGMLRSSIKEQAHAADLKLSRSRRHRSSAPLLISTDTFSFVRELKPDVKNIKKVKTDADPVDPVSEVTTEPSSRRKTRRGRNQTSQITIKEEPSSPEHPDKKWKRPARSYVVSDSDHLFIHDSQPITAPLLNKKSEIGQSKDFAMEEGEKPERFRLNEFALDWKPIIGTSPLHESIPTDRKIKREPIFHSPEDNGTFACVNEISSHVIQQSHADEISSSILDNREKVSAVSPLKSIMKTRKSILKRHVSFREKGDGQLETTIYEIPSSSSHIERQIKVEQKPCSILPEPVSEAQNASITEVTNDYEFDDRDIFKPLEGAPWEYDIADDYSDIDLEDSGDEMMIIDDF